MSQSKIKPSLIKTILIVIGTVLLCGSLWYLFDSRQVASPTQKDTTNNSTSTPNPQDLEKSRAFLQDFYTKYYYAVSAPSNPDIESAQKLKDTNLTEAFKAKIATLTGFDPIICAQELPTSPHQITATDPYNLNVEGTYGTDNPTTLKFKVTLSQELEVLKIDTITCPAN
jgi:hypothetical protein